MATRNANTASKSAPRRRPGRPTNAEIAQRVRAQHQNIVDIAAAAASAAAQGAVRAAMEAEGTVTTIGSASIAQSQPSQSQSAGRSTAAVKQTGEKRERRSPGRRTDPKSAMSLTREFFEQNKNSMPRNELVKAAAKKFKYSPATGNTYISKIAKEQGFEFGPRGRSKTDAGQSQDNGQQATGTEG